MTFWATGLFQDYHVSLRVTSQMKMVNSSEDSTLLIEDDVSRADNS